MEIVIGFIGLVLTLAGIFVAIRYGRYAQKQLEEAQLQREITQRQLAQTHKDWNQAYASWCPKYAKKVEVDLKDDWFDRFINLYIIDSRLFSSSLDGGSKSSLDIWQLVEKYLNRDNPQPIAVLGESGAGKSTLLKKLALSRLHETNKPIPVFIQLRLFNPGDTIRDRVSKCLDLPKEYKQEEDELLRDGKILLLADGLNEVDAGTVDNVVRDISKFVKDYPKCQILISCRTAEYPPMLRKDFVSAEVLPLDADAINAHILKFVTVREANIFKSLDPDTRAMCSNPLLLTMMLYPYSVGVSGLPLPLSDLPNSKVHLYERFLDALYDREERDSKQYEIKDERERHKYLSDMAFRMANRYLSVPKKQCDDWIKERYGKDKDKDNPDYHLKSIQRDVTQKPPARQTRVTQQDGTTIEVINFMHQSFQEYFTALEIKNKVMADELDLASLATYASTDNKRWIDTLLFLSGMLDDATSLVRVFMQNENYTGAARCIRSAVRGRVQSSTVDELIVRSLDRFKYKGNSNYELIYALELIADRRSDKLSSRIVNDMNYWLTKYGGASPHEMDAESYSLAHILNCLQNSINQDLRVDAAFTIRQRRKSKILSKDDVEESLATLCKCCEAASGDLLEQIISAIAEFGQDAQFTIPVLAKLIEYEEEDDERNWRIRAFALNALGKFGDINTLPILASYLLNERNKYRDSAAWSIELMIETTREVTARETLVQALYSKADQYTLGTVVYALGELQDVSLVPIILEWLGCQNNHYVIEDAIYALGRLRSADAIPILVEFLKSPDAIIRMRAINAIAEIGDQTTIKYIQSLYADESSFVAEAAEEAIKKLNIESEL